MNIHLYSISDCINFFRRDNVAVSNQQPPEVASGSLRRLGRGGLTGVVLAWLPLLGNESADAVLGSARRTGLGEPCAGLAEERPHLYPPLQTWQQHAC